MPGHVKKTEGPDPCPDQWLIVSDELKVKLKAKPYDPKKSCWVPNKATGGYNEGLIENIEGDKASVKILETGDVSIKLIVVYDVKFLYRVPRFDCTIPQYTDEESNTIVEDKDKTFSG